MQSCYMQWCIKHGGTAPPRSKSRTSYPPPPIQVQGCCEQFSLDLCGHSTVPHGYQFNTPSNKMTAKYHCPLHQDHQPHDCCRACQ